MYCMLFVLLSEMAITHISHWASPLMEFAPPTSLLACSSILVHCTVLTLLWAVEVAYECVLIPTSMSGKQERAHHSCKWSCACVHDRLFSPHQSVKAERLGNSAIKENIFFPPLNAHCRTFTLPLCQLQYMKLHI